MGTPSSLPLGEDQGKVVTGRIFRLFQGEKKKDFNHRRAATAAILSLRLSLMRAVVRGQGSTCRTLDPEGECAPVGLRPFLIELN